MKKVMKKTNTLSDAMLIIFGFLVVIGSIIGFFFYKLEENTMFTIIVITIVILVLILYIKNYKYSHYGGKFKDNFPDAK